MKKVVFILLLAIACLCASCKTGYSYNDPALNAHYCWYAYQ